MAGVSHSTDQNKLFGTKKEKDPLPSIRSIHQAHRERIETAHQILTENDPLPPSRRLVVILPDAELDIFSLAKQLWNLAAPDRRQVLLLTKPCCEENECHSRVNLTTLASLIRDSSVVVQTQVVLGMSLDQAARKYSQADDVFVCFEDHHIHGFLKKKSLADILAQKTHLPVYTLIGSISETTYPISARLIEFVSLAICLAVLIGFFGLEVWIDRNTVGDFRTILEILAVFTEAWIIAACATRSFRI
jgi:hypothetical protein